MIVFLIIVLNLIAWMYTGVRYCVPIYVDRQISYMRKNLPNLHEDRDWREGKINEAVGEGWFLALFWPIYMVKVEIASPIMARFVSSQYSREIGQSEEDLLKQEIEVLTHNLQEANASARALGREADRWKEKWESSANTAGRDKLERALEKAEAEIRQLEGLLDAKDLAERNQYRPLVEIYDDYRKAIVEIPQSWL